MANYDSLLKIVDKICPECSPCAQANCNDTYYSDCEGCGCSDCAGDCDGKLFAKLPDTKTIECRDPRVKVAQIIQTQVICADKCVISPIPTPTPTDCTGKPTSPIWVANGDKTTIGCDVFNEEVDTNPCSPTYNTIRLVDAIVINVTLNCN